MREYVFFFGGDVGHFGRLHEASTEFKGTSVERFTIENRASYGDWHMHGLRFWHSANYGQLADI